MVVHLAADVKIWAKLPPSVDAARPSRCPRCGAASRPIGGALGLWGHGHRERQIRGPVEPDGAPETAVVRARRYRCRRCDATITVLPRGAVRRRHFSAGAIALACAIYGMLGGSLSSARRRTSPWRSAEPGWPAVRRWLSAVERRTLFPGVRPWVHGASLRARAERVAATCVAFAPAALGASIAARAFAGAALVARV